MMTIETITLRATAACTTQPFLALTCEVGEETQ